MLRLEQIPEKRWRRAIAALRGVAVKRGVDRADIDDVVQSALEKALRHAGALRSEDRLEAWLSRIVANEAIDRARRRLRRPIQRSLDDAPEPVDRPLPAPPPEEALLSYADCVRPFLRRLSHNDAEALVLKDLEGRTFAETARRLSLTTPGAKARVQRARRRLADALASCCDALRAAPVAEPYDPVGAKRCCGEGA